MISGGIQIESGGFIRRCFAMRTQGSHRTAIDNFVNSGVTAGFQDVAGAFLVDPVHQAGIRQPVGINRGQVINRVAAIYRPAHGVDIADISTG